MTSPVLVMTVQYDDYDSVAAWLRQYQPIAGLPLSWVCANCPRAADGTRDALRLPRTSLRVVLPGGATTFTSGVRTSAADTSSFSMGPSISCRIPPIRSYPRWPPAPAAKSSTSQVYGLRWFRPSCEPSTNIPIGALYYVITMNRPLRSHVDSASRNPSPTVAAPVPATGESPAAPPISVGAMKT